MSLVDETPDWFDYSSIDFIACLVNSLRGEIGKAETAAKLIDEGHSLEAILPDGKKVDLVSIVVKSLEQAQELIDLAGKYAETHNNKKED
jgi:hypothetical protein